MIQSTFCILDGIGAKLEKRLWREGILSWPQFISAKNIPFFSPERKSLFDEALHSASVELENGNAGYFKDTLQSSEHWRLFNAFRGDAVCLDIETNGYAAGRGGYATLVGLYDGVEYKCFVRGRNLTKEALREELSRYKYLITFFGSAFDVPFLERSLRGLTFEMPHFDLCFGARKLGLKGGLKKLEPYFGIQRQKEVQGIESYDAVLLWREVKRGSSEALELLRLYNKEDTVNLMRIAEIIYGRLRTHTGIEKYL
ncbi:MAG: ribonuclease H-like domain-containing protein [Thermodesulfovibrionales bacterium]|nr:ribonuclease H-like domain-containing protein [Thermodesulfovibrionales bacterium]